MPSSRSRSHVAASRYHLQRVPDAGRLVEVQHHAALDVEVAVGNRNARVDTGPHRLDRHAEADHEPGREEHSR